MIAATLASMCHKKLLGVCDFLPKLHLIMRCQNCWSTLRESLAG
jgi:hypothetical protein